MNTLVNKIPIGLLVIACCGVWFLIGVWVGMIIGR
jgi:hypothetical protein